MATITLKSASYDGRYMQLVCTSTSNGAAKNSSTVKWTLSTVGGSVPCYSTGPTTVTINGTVVYSKARTAYTTEAFPAAKGSTSGSVTVPHNSDGTKSISVSFSTAIYTKTVTTKSGTLTLDPIPRYASVTHSMKSKTETTVTMNWTSDSTVDYLWYSKDDGKTWTGLDIADGKSGTYTISGLTANTAYNIKTRIRRKDSQLTTDSFTAKITTYQYPHCIDAPSFIIGEEVVLQFYNPLNRAFNFTITGNGKAIHTWTGVKGTEYRGVDGEPAVTNLYNSIPNITSAKYSVTVTYGTASKVTQGGTYMVNVDASMPTFTSFAYRDTNANVVAVTGNDQVLVQGLSNVAVVISSANKMVARCGATAAGYYTTFDVNSKDIPYTDGNINETIGVARSKGLQRIIVHAYDSRKIFGTAYKDVTVVECAKPVVNVTLQRLNNFENQTTLTINGTYSRVTVSGTDKNTVTSVQYRQREVGGTWTSYTTVQATVTGGKFTCNNIFLDLDNSKEFEFEAKAVDKFGQTTTKTASVGVGQAVFFVSSNQRTCFINGKEVDATLNFTPNGDAVGTNEYERGHQMFKKCFNGNLSSSGATEIQLPENAVVRNMYGNIYYTKGSLFIPLNYANPSAPVYTYYNVSSRKIVITPASTFLGCEYVVYVEYTIG